MSTNLSLPSPTSPDSWKGPDGKLRPEAWMALGVGAGVIGGVVWFWGIIVPFIVNMLVDTLHMVYLGGILGAILYLVFGKRPRLIFRVLVRKFTSLFVAVYPIEIIEDKLKEMKKRRDKMNEQISLVNGSITQLQRKMAENDADAAKRRGMALQAQKMAGTTQDTEEAFRMQMAMKKQANAAQRRQNANIGFAKLLERIQKVYKFLTHYATNVDYFIDDTQDDIDQKKVEYQTTMAASSAMKQAMAVIKGNATEEDIYDQAFDYIEISVSTQLGVMDDLQRISQGFMDSVDIENGAVNEQALQALNAFEQKTLMSSNGDFALVTANRGMKEKSPVTSLAMLPPETSSTYDDLLR